MPQQFQGTRTAMARIALAMDTATGLPRRGMNVGRGKHVDMSVRGSPGWTVRHADVIKRQGAEEYAYPVTDRVIALDGQTIVTDSGDVVISVAAAVERDDLAWEGAEVVRD